MNAQRGSGTLVLSVDKAMILLEILYAKRQPMLLMELASASGYPKSTTHALLATLCKHGIVAQCKDGRYYLGLKLAEYGHAVSPVWNISRTVYPHLMQLSAVVGASSFFAAAEEDRLVTFDAYAGGPSPQVMPETGPCMALHATSHGKVYLAGFADAEVRSRLANRNLQAFTPHTITKLPALLEELALVRKQGYAVEDGEYKIGLRAVSAPVRDQEGNGRYIIGVTGLFRNTRSVEFQNAISQVVYQAGQLSALGFG